MGRVGEELGLDGTHGGMASLTMSQMDPKGRPKGGRINVKVEPSARIGDGRTGVSVNVDDHYAENDDQPAAAEGVIGLFE